MCFSVRKDVNKDTFFLFERVSFIVTPNRKIVSV